MTPLFAISFLLISSFAQEPHPGPRSQEQAGFLFKEATTAQKEGKTELAIEDYRKILKTYPQYSEKFTVYQELMALYQSQKKYESVLALGKEALHLHPPRNFYNAIQLMRAEAELQLGKIDRSKIIVDELLRSKPDTDTESTALLYKAEALSQLGKHKEAFASLDAAKGNSNFADAELKIRARSCSAEQKKTKQEWLDYFHEKNLCFKESSVACRSYPAKEAAQVWCDRFQGLLDELKKSKLDQFTREKLQKEMNDTKALTAPWGCR